MLTWHGYLDILQVTNYGFVIFSGMLLRWFVNLYDLEIIEEDAFLTWKEDLSQDYPGKGKALFQVRVLDIYRVTCVIYI